MSEQTEIPVDETQDPGFVPPSDLPERVRVGDDPEPEPDEAEEEVTELTEEERAQFRTLITIGKRSKKVSLFDHTIFIRTLNCDDEMRVGLAVKDYRDTYGFSRAYQCASLAAAIESVDGESWNVSLAATPDPDELFDRKFSKVRDLHPLVVSLLYDELLALDKEFAELVAKLGKR